MTTMQQPPTDLVASFPPLRCECGEAPGYNTMLAHHISETGHVLASGELNRLHSRLKYLGKRIEATVATLAFLQSDDRTLRELQRLIEEPPKRVQSGKCRVCGDITTERFEGRPQCHKHTKGGSAVVSILETMLAKK